MKPGSITIKRIIALWCSGVLLLCTPYLFAQEDSTTSGEAKIEISFPLQDTVKQVSAKLTNAGAPVAGIDIHFYIKKSFGLLPLEGESTTTDENGEASVDFPIDIPGDASGNVVVIARVEDDENLGTVEAMKTIKWGIPVIAHEEKTRALWSSGNNAPWPLTITITSMVVVVWGIIFYMIVQLFAIKKAGKYNEL